MVFIGVALEHLDEILVMGDDDQLESLVILPLLYQVCQEPTQTSDVLAV